ncbi:MAG: hypothetical protein ACK5KR_00440 [Breznakia sp.]
MKRILSFFVGLSLAVVIGSSVVQAAQTIKVAGTTMGFTSDSGTQFNGRWATANLYGYNYRKQSVACVDTCSYSRVAGKKEWQAYVKDMGGYFSSAKAYYNYWK